MLGLSGLLSNFSTEQLGRWTRMWQPVQVVHQEVPAATERVAQGITGCLLGVPARILQWICLVVGFDLILLQGSISMWVGETIGPLLGTL